MASLCPSGAARSRLPSRAPARHFSLHLSDCTFQLFRGMPLAGRVTFPHSKYIQNTKANELSPALNACQPQPEKSIKLHSPPLEPGAHKRLKLRVLQELEAFPTWAAHPAFFGCCSSTRFFSVTQVRQPMPQAICSCLVPGSKGKAWIFARSPPRTVGKLQIKSRKIELLLYLTQSNH